MLATGGQQRIAAHRQQFAGELGGADGGQVGGVEEAGLQGALLDQLAQVIGANSGDPAHAPILRRSSMRASVSIFRSPIRTSRCRPKLRRRVSVQSVTVAGSAVLPG